MGVKVVSVLAMLWSLVLSHGSQLLLWMGIGAVLGALVGVGAGIVLFRFLRNQSYCSIEGRGSVWIPRIMSVSLPLTGLMAGVMMGAIQGVKSPIKEAVHSMSVMILQEGVNQSLSMSSNPALNPLKEGSMPIAEAEQFLVQEADELFSEEILGNLGCESSAEADDHSSGMACTISQLAKSTTLHLGEAFVGAKLQKAEAAGDNNGLIGPQDIAVVLAGYIAPLIATHVLLPQLNLMLIVFLGFRPS